jgi:hypothetical protein
MFLFLLRVRLVVFSTGLSATASSSSVSVVGPTAVLILLH